MDLVVDSDPDPRDLEVLETRIRREASTAMGLGDERDLAIFVREGGEIVAGISGWTWGDCCELQSLWVAPHRRGQGLATRLMLAAEAAAAARGCRQTVHFTYAFQAQALYEKLGYELVGRVRGFPTGTDALWYRKELHPGLSGQDRARRRTGPTSPR
ncbi:MAG TPA: GNAT family N-acetyltransferase [Acidimicrobiales bacterium]|nr:GNAT family N-acetyltransferase [Acidimicrobiales bacterium]